MDRIMTAMIFLSITAIYTLPGCSENSNEEQQDHVFKSQERAYNKAKQLQQQLDEAQEERRKKIDEQMR